ncbi:MULTISPECIES: A24 family peptidase [unclassified Sphingobium]|uniref:A24 family peptidase n=1 Tax=unclassified Sphingobium TaxID=2611147 RepID=UPI0007F49674|nr:MULTISPECIES: prepilin peptidase [unclassified Sphingobium]OAN56583.1 hypothetical protein A7Q26_18550 [Sphingobium sp. TCM1]WIW90613.1 prepilin peptidase [Sphingobium sp. V4]
MIALLSLPQLILLLSGAFASWSDVSTRRIPNWLCLLTFLLAIAATAYLQGAWVAGDHLLHAFAALAVGMALFALKAVGGGDAKFYAAVAAWFPLADAWRLFVLVSFSGLLLLAVCFAVRRMRGLPLRRQSQGMDGIPYGVAIAVGAIALASMGYGS